VHPVQPPHTVTSSPFLNPVPRRSREIARRRRRRRRRALLAGLLAVLVAIVAIVILMSKSGGSHNSASASTHPHAHPAPQSPSAALATPTRSAIGLPLGRPPLTLALSDSSDPVHLNFQHPPRGGLLFNLDTGRVLWQHDPLARVRIASLTKMMTALLVAQSQSPHAPVLVTKQAIESAGSKVGVLPLGKHVQLETMLYGLLLPSGNDAAIALAQHTAGGITAFVTRMNQQAAKLGMGCTRYSSPSGYVDQGNFSCAADLAVLAHVDMQLPRLERIVDSARAVRPFPIKGGKLYLYNNNPLLRYGYPGVTGLKTGYTLAAGKCLVATAERDGIRLAVVLLNSRNPATQARQLLDRAFQGVYRQPAVAEPPIPASQ
jgi:serine-type D-Ala-D-Ala carboxypeptidase (penicillin-binding protein 5/6)